MVQIKKYYLIFIVVGKINTLQKGDEKKIG